LTQHPQQRSKHHEGDKNLLLHWSTEKPEIESTAYVSPCSDYPILLLIVCCYEKFATFLLLPGGVSVVPDLLSCQLLTSHINALYLALSQSHTTTSKIRICSCRI
jgi:hypothetical protein